MKMSQADLVDISPATIRSRCKQVAAAPKRYDFLERLRTCEQYGALISLFSGLNFERDSDLLVGVLAIYGWMPTMMKELKSRDKLKCLIFELRIANTLRSVNSSIVGTSKLLHFFLPDKIAIWDSVIGRSFGMAHHYQFSREESFITYVDAIHVAVDLMDVPWEKLDLAVGDSVNQISNIRRVEFALYAFGRQRN